MIIIVKGSRKDLVRKQKAVMNEVNKINDPYHPKTQEAVKDFIRWSKESGQFKNTDKTSKWVTSYERKEVEKTK